jgi:hypothetical protein
MHLYCKKSRLLNVEQAAFLPDPHCCLTVLETGTGSSHSQQTEGLCFNLRLSEMKA